MACLFVSYFLTLRHLSLIFTCVTKNFEVISNSCITDKDMTIIRTCQIDLAQKIKATENKTKHKYYHLEITVSRTIPIETKWKLANTNVWIWGIFSCVISQDPYSSFCLGYLIFT